MDLFAAIHHRYPDAVPRIDFDLRDDGAGPYIAAWNLAGPMPTVDELATLALAAAKAAAWEAIKAERDRRKVGGVKVPIDGADYWFHSDDATRTQLGILDAKAIRAGWPDATVIHPEWKTMSGTKVPMTVARLREILDRGIANESALFDVAEAHRAAMEASADPASHDFSAGWPAAFGA